MISRPLLVAPIAGKAAARCALLLREWLAKVNLPGDERAYYCQVLAALDQAAAQWRAWRIEQAEAAATAADACASAVVAEVEAGSGEIDTDAAAAVLRVTPSRVRQLCRAGRLPARKVGRVWLVSAREVRMMREVRRGRL